MYSMYVLVLLCIAQIAQSQSCMSKTKMVWTSTGNQIKLNGKTFNLKGLSWFGFETGLRNLYGLDKHPVDWYLTWMKNNGFNAIRLPFSGEFMNSASNRQKYKSFIQAAGKKGILVMPDYHSYKAGAWTEGLWNLNQANAINLWGTVADLLKDEWNVFAADCYNEPHDVTNAQWGQWVSFCEKVADKIWSKGVNWLMVIEGTNYDCMGLGAPINCAWGENIMGAKTRSFSLTKYGKNRFIWSPHVYGREITTNAWSKPAWQAHWGFLVDGTTSNQAGIMIGEFGTKLWTDDQKQWLNGLVDYLVSINQRNHFYWCLNPNSGDTKGLLKDDWTSPETAKLAILSRLQPKPSVLSYNSGNGQVCVSTSANSATPIVTAIPIPTRKPTASSSGGSSSSGGGSSGSGNGIAILNRNGIHKWYYSVVIQNIGACQGKIKTAQIFERGQWRSANQQWPQGTTANGYAWNYKGVTFDSMLPISIRILFNDGSSVPLWGTVKNINVGSRFTTSKTCSSLDAPYDAFQPIDDTQFEPNDEFVLRLTMQDLLIFGLFTVNVIVVTVAIYMLCCGKSATKKNKYEAVKMMESEDEV